MPFLVTGGKASEVATDATSVHPSLRTATHLVKLWNAWTTNTPFTERDRIRSNLTEQTQALGRVVPGAGSYPNEYVNGLTIAVFWLTLDLLNL